MSNKLEVAEIKKKVEDAYNYFSANYERFYKFKQFVFKSSLSQDEINHLQKVKKPILEFNTLEAYVSRLLGEFATQEPGVKVRAAEGLDANAITPDFTMTLDVIEAHCRHIITDASNDNLQYRIYNDQLGGGFSVMRVYTEYAHSRSFEQKIRMDKVFDPTLCGFDPLARESHKGDGAYCFELAPYTKQYFIEEFGKEKLNGISFKRASAMGSFDWSYKGEREEIILVADFYFKKRKTKWLVKLADGSIGLEEDYNKKLKEYEEMGGWEVPPVVIDRRKTVIEVIELYRICENQILDHEETDYTMFPLVFVDGNSVVLRESTNGDSYQMTRPYVYHAEGIQRLRNFAGQTIGEQLQNMLQHKIKVPLEAIPDEYKSVYTDIQTASTLVYKQYSDEDPSIQYNPPMEIQQTSPPPILESTFTGADRITQSILGNYDAILGIGRQDISGKAISQGAIQSSMASDPYLVNYIRGLNRALEIIIDLIPKFYKTPRTLPVIGNDGKRAYQVINDSNDENSINFQYDPSMLQIKVEAGVNSQIQKQAALDMIAKMSASSEKFSNFINDKGLPIIIDNLDIRGSEQLKVLSEEWTQEQAQAAAQQAEQPSPIEVEAQTLIQVEEIKAQMKEMQMQADLAMKSAELALEKQRVEIEEIKALAAIGSKQTEDMIKQERLDAEQARTAVEMLKDVTEIQAEHLMEDKE